MDLNIKKTIVEFSFFRKQHVIDEIKVYKERRTILFWDK